MKGPPTEIFIDFHVRSMGPISEIDMVSMSFVKLTHSFDCANIDLYIVLENFKKFSFWVEILSFSRKFPEIFLYWRFTHASEIFLEIFTRNFPEIFLLKKKISRNFLEKLSRNISFYNTIYIYIDIRNGLLFSSNLDRQTSFIYHQIFHGNKC
jgi:hypothetical protein